MSCIISLKWGTSQKALFVKHLPFTDFSLYLFLSKMYERKKININDLNPELETALKRLIQKIAPFIPEKKKNELEKIINSQTDYINKLMEKLRNIGLFIHDPESVSK